MFFRSLLKRCVAWNQKLHIYIGLYLLVFVGFYAFSGLLLNHPKWELTQFWPHRQESTAELPVKMPVADSDLAKAQDLMRQLDVSGEINQISANAHSFEFRLSKPGLFTTVTVDPRANKATVKRTKLNVWGVLSALHHLTGVQGDGLSAQPAGYADLEPVDGRHQRQRLGVGLRWAMDLVSTPGCARPGLIALALGTLCYGFFLFCL